MQNELIKEIYSDIYRCELCAGSTDPNGVAPFIKPGIGQTIPVSHFGNIAKSFIWVVFNNPKGDRSDPNVGSTPRDFGAERRSTISDAAVTRIYEHFNKYFIPERRSHNFFNKWKILLNGIQLNNNILSFENGLIAAVDLIKCPTLSSFMGFVMKNEGKKVWDNCLRGSDGKKFLLKQIKAHEPPIIVFAGTQSCVKQEWKGRRDRELSNLALKENSKLVKDVYIDKKSGRLSLGLRRQRINLNDNDLLHEKKVIQSIFKKWE
jgi:hypothetical protein